MTWLLRIAACLLLWRLYLRQLELERSVRKTVVELHRQVGITIATQGEDIVRAFRSRDKVLRDLRERAREGVAE